MAKGVEALVTQRECGTHALLTHAFSKACLTHALEFPARPFMGWRVIWFIIKEGLREPVLNKTLLVEAFLSLHPCSFHCLSSPLMSPALTMLTPLQSKPCATHLFHASLIKHIIHQIIGITYKQLVYVRF